MGLVAALPLAVVALLGAMLTVLKPLDRSWNEELFIVATPGEAAPDLLERTRARLAAQWRGPVAMTFRPPREPHDSLWVIVRGPWNGTVFVEPSTGRELGRRGEHEGLYNLAFELHSALLMEDTGKSVLAVLSLVYLLLLLSGLVTWWPKNWRKAWALALDRGALRAAFDLHRLAGSVLGVAIAVAVVTGAYMAWRPLSFAVSAIAGDAPLKPPGVPTAAAAAGGQAPLDVLVATASQRFPGARIGYVQVPARTTQPLRVRFKLDDDPHPNGLSSVWLHPSTGEVLAVHRWNELDVGARGYTVIYPLHTGELGGTAHTVLNAVLGLALAGLACTGLWFWWMRQGVARDHRRHAADGTSVQRTIVRKPFG